jgi:hypothetical protein
MLVAARVVSKTNSTSVPGRFSLRTLLLVGTVGWMKTTAFRRFSSSNTASKAESPG